MLNLNRKAMALIAISCTAYFQATASAIDAVFYPGGEPLGSSNSKIEVQGFNGRFRLPLSIQGPAITGTNDDDSVSGVTATDTILYTLLNPPTSTSPSIITEADAHTGAYLGTIQLSNRLTDIAYTNGQLYGVQSVMASNHTQSLQVASIGADGSIQPILTQSTTSFTAQNWRLSGTVAGDSLLISPQFITTSPTAETFTPSTPSIAPSTFTLPFGTIVNDTVIHADGAAVTVTTPGQNDYSYPSGTAIGSRPLNTQYGLASSQSIVSDEFNYSYPSSEPAAIMLNVPSSTFLGTHDGLYRTPQIVSGTASITIQNGVAPDGTTLNNVAANNLLQQVSGAPLPFVFQETDAPAGSFSPRPIAQANISVNIAGATHGIYAVGINSNVTADYTTGPTTQTGRPVSVIPNGNSEFAYDPASANLVGNGDGSLGGFGWEIFDSRANIVVNAADFGGSLGLGLIPHTGDPQSLSQILSEPTSNGPMLLSFSYDISPGLDPSDLVVSLNGIQITDISVTSTTPTTFQAFINNPSLENLNNATLTFHATDTGTTGSSSVGLGSISLTAAVPEPASASLLGFAVTAVLTRRRPRKN